MSADSFHHFVEQSMDKKGKLYDYQDFLEAVETSLKSGKVEVKSMEIIDFVNFKSHISHKKKQRYRWKPGIHQRYCTSNGKKGKS